MKTAFAITIVLLCSLGAAEADIFDFFGFGKKQTNVSATLPSASVSSLSQAQIIDGLREALTKGVQEAVGRLGHEGGFLTNLDVKIPMPEKLRTVEKTLRLLRQDKLADDFVSTMNHAAEQAVPAAAPVFGSAIRQMSIADARAILTGTNNAATQYFRRTTETNLFENFLPIVKRATDQTGVTSSYKRLMEKANAATPLSTFGRSFLGQDSLDLDAYITNKALDGLFKVVAEEEKRIRENPVARTTDLLKKVFGAVTK